MINMGRSQFRSNDRTGPDRCDRRHDRDAHPVDNCVDNSGSSGDNDQVRKVITTAARLRAVCPPAVHVRATPTDLHGQRLSTLSTPLTTTTVLLS